MKLPSNTVCLVVFCIILVKVINSELQTNSTSTSQKILSRKKRFLIFPEGSSLQLVYCLTIPSVGMGSIFTIGWTAALAWELPHEPIHPYRKKGGALRRVDEPGTSTSGGWAVKKGTVPSSYSPATSGGKNKKDYYNSIVSGSSYSTIKDHLTKPGYSKIGYNSRPDTNYREYLKGKYVDYRPIYDALAIRPSLKSNKVTKEATPTPFYVDPVYKDVHRRTRRDLFGKIERFLAAQKLDGKACLLKAICEVSKTSGNEVGTFMEEIIKAVFRIKPYKHEVIEDEYDFAADETHNCTEKYPRCSSSVWSLL